ncbi:hypothetical protein AgCh_031933 [Apium graveolens]
MGANVLTTFDDNGPGLENGISEADDTPLEEETWICEKYTYKNEFEHNICYQCLQGERLKLKWQEFNLMDRNNTHHLGHMFEVHQNTTRMYSLDKCDGSGLVIDDEKYRRKKEKSTYTSQVGVNLNNKTKGSKESHVQITDQKYSESPLNIELQLRASVLDASEKIAYSSRLESSKD